MCNFASASRTAMVLLACIIYALAVVSAQDLITINSPTENQQLASNTEITIQYTVNGNQVENIASPYYPSSMDLNFQWTENSNTSNVISFSAVTGIATDPYPAGIQNKQYTATFKTPGCHFFTRYQTSQYSFALVFNPVYPTLSPGATAPGNTQQSPITIPVSIQVNNQTFPRC
ncbi:hypothetical protein VTP01DRAFT_7597 [Rhizomucor pusillus]|uniref:uncharacterized protein n=1 Tax=Rhizomucor pusillus TaxID=4840 RepID=UPI003742D11D